MFKKLIKSLLSLPIFSYIVTFVIKFFVKKTIIDDKKYNLDYLIEKRSDNGKSCIRTKSVAFLDEYDLSIIVPCYNSERFIEKCAKSLINQKTKFKYQIIFIDDGSTDNTLNLLKEICSKCEFISILHQDNKGAAGARNLGILNSSGKYITFVDSDDYISNNYLIENLLSAINKRIGDDNSSIVVEYNFKKEVSNNKNQKRREIKLKEVKPNKLKGFACGKIYSSSLFSNVCFPEGYDFEDSINTLILFPLAKKVFLTNETGYIYLERGDNSTHVALNSDALIDTFYVTRRLLLDAENLHLLDSNDYADLIMRQIVCNFKRLSNACESIKWSVFVETRKILISLKIESKINLKYRNVFNALIKNNYNWCVSSCKIIQ